MIFFSVHIILSIDKADIYRTTHKKDALIARASILAS